MLRGSRGVESYSKQRKADKGRSPDSSRNHEAWEWLSHGDQREASEMGLNQRAGANGPENPEMVHGNPEPLGQWKTTGLGGKSHA